MAVAWGAVRGRVVFDSSQHTMLMERQPSGFSWTGTRSLPLTDQPAVYVHDTGGLGNPAALTGLRGRLMPGAGATDFISPCAISITPRNEAEPGADDEGAPAEPAAYVVVAGGRRQLRSHGRIPLEWPVNRVTVSPAGPSAVELRSGALLGGDGDFFYLIDGDSSLTIG